MKTEKKLASATRRLVPTLLVAVAITLFACKGDEPLAAKHNVEFILELPTGIDASALEAVEVSLTGASLAKKEKGKCNAEGKV